MTPTTDRMSFLVRFLAMDLTHLSSSAWQKLKKDIKHFLTADPGRIPEKGAARWGIVARPPLHVRYEELTEQEIKELQNETREFLSLALKEPKEEESVRATTPVSISGKFQLWIPGPGRFLFIEGSAREMFLLVLHFLLIRGADERLRCCPECEKIFVRITKQIYCGQRCKTRANIRAWRETPQGRKYQKDASRTQYERKVRSQPGMRNAKVTRYDKR